MTKAALVTGAYQTKSVIAGAQRCVNLYMEKNPETSVFPFTHYPTPGLTLIKTAPSGSTWRGLYFASTNVLYGVCGNAVYLITPSWQFSLLGTINSSSGTVSMVDNGQYLFIVDGTTYSSTNPAGWTVNLTTNLLAPVNNSAGTGGDQGGFYGSNQVNYVDGYLIFNRPSTNQWYISLNNSIQIDPVDYASKSGYSDNIVGIGVSRRYIYLFGEFTTEVWFNAGNTAFPFQEMPGTFMQYGCAATNSIAQLDGQMFWLAQSEQGQAFVCMTQNFAAVQISTFAIDQELQTYPTLSDAIGYTYEVNGHFFYVLTFPSANKTWVYDYSNQQWNEWASMDSDGNLNRHLSNCFCFAYNQLVVGDWKSGNLYLLDQNNYTDNGMPINRIRGFYHQEDGMSDRVRYKQFIAEMESGDGYNNQPMTVFLSWSDNRGQSYGNPIGQTIGVEGEYLTSINWWRLGMARDRVFEIQWSDPCKTALSGAFIDAEPNRK
jgi:hypothetical protein